MFGHFPVEAVSFERDLQAINIHGTGGLSGISGISIQTSSGTDHAGACHIVPVSMTLDAPQGDSRRSMCGRLGFTLLQLQ